MKNLLNNLLLQSLSPRIVFAMVHWLGLIIFQDQYNNINLTDLEVLLFFYILSLLILYKKYFLGF